MTWELVVLCLAAAAAGMINSVAGGGTLISFPALVSVLGGTPEAAVIANATNTAALCPGSFAAAWGYRRELYAGRRWLLWLLPVSCLGAVTGSFLVVLLPAVWFRVLVPWLILLATALFALQPLLTRWTGIGQPHAEPAPRVLAGIVVFQFLVGLYGGYFGAGIGILMLAALSLMGLGDIHRMNGVKNFLAFAINGLSVVVFQWSGQINWTLAWPMIAAAIAGGYIGSKLIQRLNKQVVRSVVIAIGTVLTINYFLPR